MSPADSRVKDFAGAATREEVSTPSPVRPTKPSADELRLNFKHEQLSDVIEESNENTTNRQPIEAKEEKEEEKMGESKARHRLNRSKTQQHIKDIYELPHYMKKNASLEEIPAEDEPDHIEEKEEEEEAALPVQKKVVEHPAVEVKEAPSAGGLRTALIVLALLLLFLGSMANIPALRRKVKLDRLAEGEATVKRGKGRGRVRG